MSKWLSRRLQLDALGRHPALSERATLLALAARFVDEFASGIVLVLLPTLRRTAGLGVGGIGLLLQVMDLVGGLADPAAGIAADLWRRRPLLVAGALGWAAALGTIALSPSLPGLVVAFACIGAASGMLAHTADVVLIEGHPDAADRISTVSTIVDTVGAILAPTVVVVLFRGDGSWRLLLLASAVAVTGYALLSVRTSFPVPVAEARPPGSPLRGLMMEVRDRVRSILADRDARRWVAVLLLDGLVDVAVAFEPLWLVDVAGFGQAGVGVHVAIELAASLVGLLVLDRMLRRWDAVLVLRWSLATLMVVWTAWVLVDGPAGQLLLVVPRAMAAAPIWPIARARALASLPGNAGTVGAVLSASALLPTAAVFGWAAGAVGLTPVMLGVPALAFAGMLLVTARPSGR